MTKHPSTQARKKLEFRMPKSEMATIAGAICCRAT